MKKFLITLLLFLIMLPAVAKTLTGGVVYTVESARKAAFEGIEYEISMEPFKKYMTDPGFISPAKTEGGKPKVSKKGRKIVLFYRGEYCINYDDSPSLDYYYNAAGKLIAVGMFVKNRHTVKKYPRLYLKYDIVGHLESVTYYTARGESFTYDKNKSFIVHWKNNKGYDANGKIINKRIY